MTEKNTPEERYPRDPYCKHTPPYGNGCSPPPAPLADGVTDKTSTLQAVKLIDQIKHLGPCREAVEWLGNRTLRQAWRTCPRGDWMLWLAGQLDVDRKVLVRAAIECARPALKYVPRGEKRPARALSVALAWTQGRATIDEVRAAADAASAAAYAAYADAAYSAYHAAHAIAYAAAYSAARRRPADAIAYAAAAAAAADAAAYAAYADAAYSARKKSLRESANTVRRLIPVELIENTLAEIGEEK